MSERRPRRMKKNQGLIQNIWNHYTLMVVHSRRTAIIIMMILARLCFSLSARLVCINTPGPGTTTARKDQMKGKEKQTEFQNKILITREKKL